ncbi:hypothetical protein TNCV_71301 [Trichonephila clavipes]|nr:hypothetical protein TNCV_71301 [Trichonephila clavipes]
MSRSGGLMRDPQCLRPQASLVLIYRPTAVGRKGWVDLAQPGNRTQICGVETRYATTRPLGLTSQFEVSFSQIKINQSSP